jgi:CelD/BcsL family acetyltransferase involved in cellulose biosynthesis
VLTARLIEDLPALEELREEWDELAVLAALPLMAPAWILPWLRRLAPSGAEPRVVAVYEDDQMVGIAPFYTVRDGSRGRVDYRLPGIELGARLAPLARPGREWEVAEAIAGALREAEHRPDVLALAPTELASPWLMALREGWPGRLRPRAFTYDVQEAPIVSLHAESFDEWLSTRSAKFRRNMRRLGRMFVDEGGTMRLSDAGTLGGDVASLSRLHATRWEGKGGHSRLVALGGRFDAMLADVGHALLIDDPRRFRLRLLEIAGETVCAEVSIAGGGEIVGFNNGWDERYKRLSPPLLALLHDIEEGFAHGDRRLQLGWGGNMYKQRFANGNDPVAWSLLLAPGRRLPLTLASVGGLLGSSWLRGSGKRLLSESQLDRLRPLAGRLPR